MATLPRKSKHINALDIRRKVINAVRLLQGETGTTLTEVKKYLKSIKNVEIPNGHINLAIVKAIDEGVLIKSGRKYKVQTPDVRKNVLRAASPRPVKPKPVALKLRPTTMKSNNLGRSISKRRQSERRNLQNRSRRSALPRPNFNNAVKSSKKKDYRRNATIREVAKRRKTRTRNRMRSPGPRKRQSRTARRIPKPPHHPLATQHKGAASLKNPVGRRTSLSRVSDQPILGRTSTVSLENFKEELQKNVAVPDDEFLQAFVEAVVQENFENVHTIGRRTRRPSTVKRNSRVGSLSPEIKRIKAEVSFDGFKNALQSSVLVTDGQINLAFRRASSKAEMRKRNRSPSPGGLLSKKRAKLRSKVTKNKMLSKRKNIRKKRY